MAVSVKLRDKISTLRNDLLFPAHRMLSFRVAATESSAKRLASVNTRSNYINLLKPNGTYMYQLL
jgi:hypothetical protein